MSGRWIRPGLRYHQQGPGHNIRWDRSGLAALAIVYNKEKEMANTGIEKRKANTKEGHTYTKESSPDCFCFLLLNLLFSLHLSFMTSKALKLKKKTKIKKNQSPDPAILGRVRTRDPDPDHFGPDFDSGSGCGSAFTDLQSGSPQKHGLV